ncbi:MAG: DMT family transporter [Oscillospiraceae bacterium]
MIIIKNAIYIITAGTLWGIISLFVNQLKMIGFNSMQVVSIRVFFSAVILVLYLLIKDKEQLKIRIKDIPLFIGTGVGSIIFFNYCYFEAIEIIGGASVPALLLYTAPIFVMILSLILFKEKITKKKVLSLIMTFIGLILVTGAFSNSDRIPFSGLLLGLGSGFGYALYSIFGKSLVNKYSAITITAYTFVVATIFSLPFSGVVQKVELIVSVKGLSSALALAIVSTVLPFLFYTKGLSGMEAGKASILATVEPFVATIVGIIFFKESLSLSKIVGMLMIVIAIIILNVNFESKNHDLSKKKL